MSFYIYKICCDDCLEFNYIGSTKAFINRKHLHKSRCNNVDQKSHNNKLYTTIRANGGWENWRMVVIEECKDITLTESKIKEEEWRVKLQANLNMRKCHTTEEEKKRQKKIYDKNYKKRIKEKEIKEKINSLPVVPVEQPPLVHQLVQ